MKNLKKLISVIIAVMMLVSSFAAVSAADYADVESTNSYYKAIKVLSGLGIAKGDEEGNFNPDNEVKRSEMVAFLSRALGEEDIAKASATNAFSDVAADHWAVGYIAWGVNNGIIKGMGDGTFAPDAAVSYQDAVVMIMRALGYDYIAVKNGGYPTGYLKYASQYGVLKSAGFDNQAAAPRKIIAQLIYNALTAPTVSLEYTTEGETYVINKGSKDENPVTLLDGLGIVKVKAEITETPKANGGYVDKAGNYQVQIKVEGTYDYDDVDDVLGYGNDGLVVVYVGETEAAELVDSTVEAYLVEDEDLNDWKLVALVADAKTAIEETIAIADITPKSYEEGLITYYDENDKEVEIEIAKEADFKVYFNGQTIDSPEDAKATSWENLFFGVADQLTFKGDKKSGTYDVIYVTDYQYVQVVEVDADKERITVTEDGVTEKVLNFAEEKFYAEGFVYGIYDAEGAAMELADIAEGDILNIAAPVTKEGAYPSYNKKTVPYVDIYVSNETVAGRIEGEVVAGSKYVVDGNVYSFIADVSDKNLGDEGTFYLTIDGKVFLYEADATIAKNYAFIIKAGSYASALDNTCEAELFLADGTKKTFSFASTVNVYREEGNFEKEALKGDALVAFAEELRALTVDKSEADAKAALEDRLITYALNADGDIKEIRMAGSDDFESEYVEKATYYADTAEFTAGDLSDSSLLIVAPIEGKDNAFNVNVDKLAIASFDALIDEDGYNVFAFSDDKYLNVAILGEEIASDMTFARLAVVQSVVSTVDEEGNVVYAYTFVQGEETLKLALEVDYNKKLSAGDIFRYTVNADGDINDIQTVYDADDEDPFNDFGLVYDEIKENDIAIVYGKIAEIKAGKMLLEGEGVPARTLTFATGEGFTYASIDEERVNGTFNPGAGVEVLSGAGDLVASDDFDEYYVVSIIGKNNQFEDCVMIIK